MVITLKPRHIWLIVGALVAATGAYWWLTHQAASPIPPDIQKQLTFSPYIVPVGTKGYSSDNYAFATAENDIRVFSFVLQTPSASVAISEQSQPTEFSDIPEYKDRVLSNVIKQYAVVSSGGGTIYLGRASKDNNRQLGVMIERGLLVFMKPDKDLPEAEWRQIGDLLEIEKISN